MEISEDRYTLRNTWLRQRSCISIIVGPSSGGHRHVPRIPRRCISVLQKWNFLERILGTFLVDRRSTPTHLSRRRVACNHNSASRSRWDTSRWKSCITFVSLTQHRGPAFCIGERKSEIKSSQCGSVFIGPGIPHQPTSRRPRRVMYRGQN